ncbi:hypothetical protein BDK51DRAFT_44777, partial [Blyttiomyces helicus]
PDPHPQVSDRLETLASRLHSTLATLDASICSSDDDIAAPPALEKAQSVLEAVDAFSRAENDLISRGPVVVDDRLVRSFASSVRDFPAKADAAVKKELEKLINIVMDEVRFAYEEDLLEEGEDPEASIAECRRQVQTISRSYDLAAELDSLIRNFIETRFRDCALDVYSAMTASACGQAGERIEAKLRAVEEDVAALTQGSVQQVNIGIYDVKELRGLWAGASSHGIYPFLQRPVPTPVVVPRPAPRPTSFYGGRSQGNIAADAPPAVSPRPSPQIPSPGGPPVVPPSPAAQSPGAGPGGPPVVAPSPAAQSPGVPPPTVPRSNVARPQTIAGDLRRVAHTPDVPRPHSVATTDLPPQPPAHTKPSHRSSILVSANPDRGSIELPSHPVPSMDAAEPHQAAAPPTKRDGRLNLVADLNRMLAGPPPKIKKHHAEVDADAEGETDGGTPIGIGEAESAESIVDDSAPPAPEEEREPEPVVSTVAPIAVAPTLSPIPPARNSSTIPRQAPAPEPDALRASPRSSTNTLNAPVPAPAAAVSPARQAAPTPASLSSTAAHEEKNKKSPKTGFKGMLSHLTKSRPKPTKKTSGGRKEEEVVEAPPPQQRRLSTEVASTPPVVTLPTFTPLAAPEYTEEPTEPVESPAPTPAAHPTEPPPPVARPPATLPRPAFHPELVEATPDAEPAPPAQTDDEEPPAAPIKPKKPQPSGAMNALASVMRGGTVRRAQATPQPQEEALVDDAADGESIRSAHSEQQSLADRSSTYSLDATATEPPAPRPRPPIPMVSPARRSTISDESPMSPVSPAHRMSTSLDHLSHPNHPAPAPATRPRPPRAVASNPPAPAPRPTSVYGSGPILPDDAPPAQATTEQAHPPIPVPRPRPPKPAPADRPTSSAERPVSTTSSSYPADRPASAYAHPDRPVSAYFHADEDAPAAEDEHVEEKPPPPPPKRKIPGVFATNHGALGALAAAMRGQGGGRGGEEEAEVGENGPPRPPVPASKTVTVDTNVETAHEEGDGSAVQHDETASPAPIRRSATHSVPDVNVFSGPTLSFKRKENSSSGDDKAIEKSALEWLNKYLSSQSIEVDNLYTSLGNGLNLIYALEAYTGESVGKYNKRAMLPVHRIDNIAVALNFLGRKGINTSFLNAQDVMDGDRGKILTLFTYILKTFPL